MSSTADIKRHQHTLIDTVDSRSVLLAVETFLTQPAPVSPALDQALEEALQQSAAGLGRTHAEVMATAYARLQPEA